MSDVTVSDHIAAMYEERGTATSARLRWAKYEKDLTAKLHEALGYDGEEKPETKTAVNAAGVPLFVVDVTTRKDIDRERLARLYPAAYADCETTIYVKTIRAVKAADS